MLRAKCSGSLTLQRARYTTSVPSSKHLFNQSPEEIAFRRAVAANRWDRETQQYLWTSWQHILAHRCFPPYRLALLLPDLKEGTGFGGSRAGAVARAPCCWTPRGRLARRRFLASLAHHAARPLAQFTAARRPGVRPGPRPVGAGWGFRAQPPWPLHGCGHSSRYAASFTSEREHFARQPGSTASSARPRSRCSCAVVKYQI